MRLHAAQIMKAFRATSHRVTNETANYLMLGRETRLLDQLVCAAPLSTLQSRVQYACELGQRLARVRAILREKQSNIRQQDREEPLLFAPGDMAWQENKRRRKGVNPKLQAKSAGSYKVLQSHNNLTTRIITKGQTSIQSEKCLKNIRSRLILPARRHMR